MTASKAVRDSIFPLASNFCIALCREPLVVSSEPSACSARSICFLLVALVAIIIVSFNGDVAPLLRRFKSLFIFQGGTDAEVLCTIDAAPDADVVVKGVAEAFDPPPIVSAECDIGDAERSFPPFSDPSPNIVAVINESYQTIPATYFHVCELARTQDPSRHDLVGLAAEGSK